MTIIISTQTRNKLQLFHISTALIAALAPSLCPTTYFTSAQEPQLSITITKIFSCKIASSIGRRCHSTKTRSFRSMWSDMHPSLTTCFRCIYTTHFNPDVRLCCSHHRILLCALWLSTAFFYEHKKSYLHCFSKPCQTCSPIVTGKGYVAYQNIYS